MNKIVYDMDTIKFISAFQGLTGTTVRDCIVSENSLLFIVQEGEIGKAIGKNAENVRRLANGFKRKIKIVEFSADLLKFIKNIVQPLKIAEIEEREGTVFITAPDLQTRGYLIGRGGSSLRQLEETVKRHFEIKEIKVM